MFSYLPLSSMTYKTFSSRVNETEKPFKDSLQSWTKYWRQIHKIKRNRFFYGMFSVDFLQLFTKIRQILALGWTAGYSPSNPSVSGIFLKSNNDFLKS